MTRRYPGELLNVFPMAGGDPGGRIKHVWETSDDVLLVLGEFASISLPKRSLPEGAGESIRASVRDAG